MAIALGRNYQGGYYLLWVAVELYGLYGYSVLVVFIAEFSPTKKEIVTDLRHLYWHVLMIATWNCVVNRILPKLLAIPYQYFLLKSLLTTSLPVVLQLLFQNYLSVTIAPSKCLRNVHLLCKCNVMPSSKINVRFDSSKFRLVIWKRTKEKKEKRHFNKIYHHSTRALKC